MWADDKHCIACGSENPIGFRLKFELKEGKLFTEHAFDKRFQGYADVVHGGMIALVLDEVMVTLPWRRDKVPVISGELNMRLHKAAKIGDRLKFEAECGDTRRRLIQALGRCYNSAGELVAEASARCVKIKNPILPEE